MSAFNATPVHCFLSPASLSSHERLHASSTSTTTLFNNPWLFPDSCCNHVNSSLSSSLDEYSSSIPTGYVKSELAAELTPNPKRRRTVKESPSKPPPPTPTLSNVHFMAAGALPTVNQSSSSLQPRPADPHAANAPLSTPRGSRVVAYSNTTPVKWSVPLPTPTSSTETLLAEGCKHLIEIDPRLRTIIERNHCKIFSPDGLKEVIDPFMSLASGIIGQQVSGAAASSIRKKFVLLFDANPPKDYFPSPEAIAKTSIEKLRTAGLSQRKAEYIQGLAEKFNSGELSAQKLVSATDQEVMHMLVTVRGIGPWSAEMFATFALKRMDVFSTGDLGIQRGMAVLAGRDVNKLRTKGGKWKYMTEKEMVEMSSKFAPYRSLFMWYMWRLSDTNTDVLTT
ncbi:DNA glycosylase [Pseudovirgaria hyperparasitica]|uniref:DNA glycosylase n=1 Tax=Pseudovirgaria hyperparasitica TaxID=470096 RepID=A0A6A6WDB8_9PEZI|nr:DNA glycosylase [Pseudovirgaria hyperparasitica]KAF2759557.1 DNA glycosylase [Pseudovirgaria hyperparasitica]